MSDVEWRLRVPEDAKRATRPDVRVARLAAGQHGVVARRQLEECGMSRQAIRARIARGGLHPLYRGVYAVGHEALTQTARFMAAVLVCGDGAVLADYAAAAYLRLLEWRARAVDVIVPRGGGRKLDGIRAHRRTLDRRDVWRRAGIDVTSPARTILDLAATMPAGALRRMVRQAQAERRVNVRQLVEILGRHRGHRGAAKLRAVIAEGAAPTRSELEDLVLDLIVRARIARPAINPTLRLEGRSITPDLLWREQRLIVECDGRRWHGDPLTRRDDVDKQAILEDHGYRVLRITWQQAVDHPRQTIARVRAALAGGR